MSSYQKLYIQIQRLPYEEQWQLLTALLASIRKRSVEKHLHSITELEGLGKETWQGIDVDIFIDDERNSWDK